MNPENSNIPYLSIVLAGRNDNYGGDFEERMRWCLQWLQTMLSAYPIATELLVINYNPVADRPALQDVLPLSFNLQNVSVRYITVSNEVHQNYLKEYPVKKLPFLEYVAKNVGIYRAKGEYILCINPDIIIPKETFAYIYAKKLSDGFFYRADRFDHNIIERNIAEQDKYIQHAKSNTFRMFMMANIVPFAVRNNIALRVFRHLNQWYARYLFYYYYYASIVYPLFFPKFFVRPEMRWHCNASGDFMLMHRSKWLALNGYAEKQFLPLHVDAAFVVKAGVYGLQQITFIMPVYHQHHERRFDTANNDDEMTTAYETFYENCSDMMSKGTRSKFFKPDEIWGLNNHTLPEVQIA